MVSFFLLHPQRVAMQFSSRPTALLTLLFASCVVAQVGPAVPTQEQITKVKVDFVAIDKATTDLYTSFMSNSLTDDSAKQTVQKSQALAAAIQMATQDVEALPNIIPDEDARDVLNNVTNTGKTTTNLENRLVDVRHFIEAYGAGTQTADSINSFRTISSQLNDALYKKMPGDLQAELKKVTDQMQKDFDRAAKAYAKDASAPPKGGAAAGNGMGNGTNGTTSSTTAGGASNSTEGKSNTAAAGKTDGAEAVWSLNGPTIFGFAVFVAAAHTFR